MNTQVKGTQGQIQNNNLDQKVVSEWKGTKTELEPGKNVTSMLPGILYPIMFKEVLAGEKVITWDIDNLSRILTPLVPTMDQVFINIKAFFVPHTRVWEDAEKVLANKLDMEATNISELGRSTEIPNCAVPASYTNNYRWKDNLFSRYGAASWQSPDIMYYNALLPRGYRAIWNDYVRNKEYQLPKTEWKDNKVTAAEAEALLPFQGGNNYPQQPSNPVTNGSAYLIAPAAARKSYLTNIKRTIQASDNPDPIIPVSDHLDWQTRFMDQKQRIDNANKTDWEIIAEMGGTQPVTADRVQFLGQVEYELNYQQITQSTPQIDNSSPLGTTGAFSYSKASGNLISYKEFQQHGFIHILASITIPTLFDQMIPKELTKIDAQEDIYRPGMAKKEVQLLKASEISSNCSMSGIAYQPAWAEYKRMPSFVTGEMKEQTYKLGINNVVNTSSYAHWHNIPQSPSSSTITGDYFTPYQNAVRTLGRNNILEYGDLLDYRLGDNASGYAPDMIMNMSLHKVKTILPIAEATIKQKSKAEQTR